MFLLMKALNMYCIWMPADYEVRVDGLFNSLQFERIRIPDTAIDGEDSQGTPAEICTRITSEINKKLAELDVLDKNIAAYSAQYGREGCAPVSGDREKKRDF